MAKLFSFFVIFMALVPFSARAAVGDTYLCLSSQYVEIKEGEPVRSFRPVKFEFIWDSPKDSDEQIVWFPRHPELMVSETLYVKREAPRFDRDGVDMFSFYLHPLNETVLYSSSGLFSEGRLYLTNNSIFGITSLIANCEKTVG